MYRKYFDYYLELERDFFVTEPYVLIDKDNYGAFSVQYNRIFQSICSEIDCLLKVLCMCLEPESAYSARTAHPFQRNGAPFRFKLSKAQQVD